jgi:hypothetical protein
MKKTKITALLLTIAIITCNAINVLAFNPVSHALVIDEIAKKLPDGNPFKNAIYLYPYFARYGSAGADLGYATYEYLYTVSMNQVDDKYNIYAPWDGIWHYKRPGIFIRDLIKYSVDKFNGATNVDELESAYRVMAFAAGYMCHLLADRRGDMEVLENLNYKN